MIVRGTQNEVIPVEVNVDTVYVRQNIRRIEEDRFIGWEYEEEQIDKNEYIARISKENTLNTSKIQTLTEENLSLMEASMDLYIENQRLHEEDLSNKEAILDIYMLTTGG